MGEGDAYLVAINRAISEWAKPVYLRPFGEMNGYWNFYERLYRAHPSKLYAFPEWGKLGHRRSRLHPEDGEVRTPAPSSRDARLLRQHVGSVFDLGSKPLSRAAYRRYITPLGG
jgi:hypothetical protein